LPRRAEIALAPVLFALLVAATLGAFAGAQRLKREPLVLDKLTLTPLVSGNAVITPNGDGRSEVARIRFRLTKADRGRVEIIDKDDRAVRALSGRVVDRRGGPGPRVVPGSLLPSYKPLVFRWDGRDGSGKVVPTGPYRLRVSLLTEDRTLIPLGRIRVHAGVAAGAGGGPG
jgi:hypothetical protein